MRVGLVTEGTYPHHPGGVSVWCNQLVTGLSDVEFEVVAIADHASRPHTWVLPPNVRHVDTLGLWEPAPVPTQERRSTDDAFAPYHWQFLDALLAEEEDDGTRMLEALRGLYAFSRRNDLTAALVSDRSIERTLEAWSAAVLDSRLGIARVTVGDAVRVTDMMERFLRPLTIDPPAVDIMHSTANGLGTLVGMTAKWSHGSRFMLTEHAVYLRERYLERTSPHSRQTQALVLRFHRRLATAAYRIADVITSVNDYNHRWLARVGADAEMVVTVNNGIDPTRFPSQAHAEPEVPTIAFVGRIDPLKDLETLITGFAGVRAEIPEARLRIFGPVPTGNDWYLRKCQRLVESLGLTGSATFEGPVASAVEACEAGHVVALTSISEGFPYTVIEAMASARPTVSTRVGGVAEAVGEAGVLIPARDPAAFAKACVELLERPLLRKALGAAARNRVLEKFTLDKILAKYLDIYTELEATPVPIPVFGTPESLREHAERHALTLTPAFATAGGTYQEPGRKDAS